jgi:hypothetical protein
VKNLLNFVQDDDNDTAVFEALQRDAMENCPNPKRIGCPDHSILQGFVEAPRKIDLKSLNDLHIFKCAECTRDLLKLQRNREDRLAGSNPVLRTAIFPIWKYTALAASLCLVVGIALWMSRLLKLSRIDEPLQLSRQRWL